MEKKPQEKQQPRCVDSACGLVHSAVNLVGGGLARTASVGPRPPLQPANTNLWYVLNKRSFFSLLLLLIVVASIHYYYYCGHVLPIVLECSEQDRQQWHKKYEYQHCKSAYMDHIFASPANFSSTKPIEIPKSQCSINSRSMCIWRYIFNSSARRYFLNRQFFYFPIEVYQFRHNGVLCGRDCRIVGPAKHIPNASIHFE